MKSIETERLILRNFKEEDYDDLFELLSQRKDDLFEAYPGITFENGREHLKYRLGNDEFVAISLKSENKIIGNICLGKRNFNTLEIGYIVNKRYQRKGYAKEAATRLIEEAFSSGVHRIYGESNPRNECSISFLESLGFVQEALFKQNVSSRNDKDGKPIYQDTAVFSLLSDK